MSSFQPSEFDVYDKQGRYVGWRMHYNDQAYDITVARDCDERHYSNAALCAMLCDTGFLVEVDCKSMFDFADAFSNQHFDVSSSVGNDQWNGPVQQNFKRLYLGHIEVDSTEFWMDRVLSAGSF